MTMTTKTCAMRFAVLVGLALVNPALALAATQAPPPSEFAWRGTLTLPTGASLARIDVPVQALLHMQNDAAYDLRVFNAAGAVVPFAILAGADLSRTAAALQTGSYDAYPLYASTSSGRPARGGVEVRVDTADGHGSAWVRWDNAQAQAGTGTGTQALQAALFDLREQKQTVDALALVVDLPRNALVPVSVAVSADLKDWTELATKGPLYQFDGADAPSNTTLELRQPQQLRGRYLKLAWPGQTGVKLRSLAGRVAATQTQPEPLRAPLPAGVPDATGGLSWSLPFATPIAALQVLAAQDNTLVPVRIHGRTVASQPWRTLASTVVYRLDTAGPHGSSNPATPLRGASLRALRVDASQGHSLPPGGLQATVEFAPLQVVFLASGAGPFTLAVGRANTPAAAMDASLLGSIAPAKLLELPMASLADVQVQEPAQGPIERIATGWLPDGVPLRSALLWAVLGVGVLALGGVAYSLMRQLAAKR